MQKKSQVSKEQIEDWLTHPVTKKYFEVLKIEAILRREAAAYGSLKRESVYETGEAYIKQMIQAEVYEACASPTVDDLLDEENNEEN